MSRWRVPAILTGILQVPFQPPVRRSVNLSLKTKLRCLQNKMRFGKKNGGGVLKKSVVNLVDFIRNGSLLNAKNSRKTLHFGHIGFDDQTNKFTFQNTIDCISRLFVYNCITKDTINVFLHRISLSLYTTKYRNILYKSRCVDEEEKDFNFVMEGLFLHVSLLMFHQTLNSR